MDNIFNRRKINISSNKINNNVETENLYRESYKNVKRSER